MARQNKKTPSNPPRKCIFCAERGASREHVFAQWLAPYFPYERSATYTFGKLDWRPNKVIGVPKQHVRPGVGNQTVVKAPCKECNNTWMKDLEEGARPHLVPMFTGETARVTPEAQKALAAWAAKTATVAEHISPRSDGISQSERTWIYEKLIPPRGWMVWIAGYAGGNWANLTIFQDRGTLLVPTVSPPRIGRDYVHATTWGMGHVLFLVVGCASPRAQRQFGHLEGRGLFRIWPRRVARSILWPPADLLRDPQANALANLFRRKGGFNQALNPGANWTFTP